MSGEEKRGRRKKAPSGRRTGQSRAGRRGTGKSPWDLPVLSALKKEEGAALLPPSIEISKGGAALWAAEPKTKGTTKVVPFVLEETVKTDILDECHEVDIRERTTLPAFWPAARVRRTSVFTAGENLGGRAALPP